MFTLGKIVPAVCAVFIEKSTAIYCTSFGKYGMWIPGCVSLNAGAYAIVYDYRLAAYFPLEQGKPYHSATMYQTVQGNPDESLARRPILFLPR